MWAGADVKYVTIVADPPWSYRKSKPTGDEQHNRRWAEDVYPTMKMKEIAALPVGDLAAENAHLYLWVTNPRLFGDRFDNSFGPVQIMEGWGFRYATMLTWVKTQPGLGSYFRGHTEHVLFGVRGSLPVEPSKRPPNYFIAPRTTHSAKPECFLDLVEAVSPGPYLELFARRNRMGWDTWGNESLEHVAL